MVMIIFYVKTDDDKLQLTVLSQFTLMIFSILTYKSNNIFGYLVYGSSVRIRDGTAGRLNILTVRLIGFPSTIIIGSILSIYKDSLTTDEKKIALVLMYIPLIIGDAMGEIIGSLYGSRFYKVYGIGEINKKSYEGTFAVFFSSIVVSIVVCIFYTVNNNTYILIVVISIISSIVEAVAIRSTDNFFIPVINSLIIYIWTSNIESTLV
jgi:dolichol kinase